MVLKIVSRYDANKILYQAEAESMRLLVEAAVKARADLRGADLRGADLRGADLRGAYLSGAYLRGADLREADLGEADLGRAYLSGVDLCEADLGEADLGGAKGLAGFHSFGPGGSRSAYTWARWEADGYMVHCGCQTLNLKDFAKAVRAKHGKTYHAKWYAANIAVMRLVAEESEAAYRKENGG